MIRRLLPALLLILLPALLLAQSNPGGKSSWIAGASYDGVDVSADLPDSEQMKNIGSKLGDHAGMCVFSAIEMAARYQGLEQMRGWRDWCAANYTGGGYPQKVDKLLAAWWKKNGVAPIPYAQYEGNDPGPFLDLINRTNRMASLTYNYSPRYGRWVPHMTNAILFGTKYAVVLDNNFPGEKNYEWMSPAELIRRSRLDQFGKQGVSWVFCWLTPGAPPPIHPKRDPSLPNTPAPAPTPAPTPAPAPRLKLVYVTSPACVYCVKFERTTLADPGIKSKLAGYEFVKVNNASTYNVSAVPAYLLFDGAREVRRGSGYRSPAQFVAWLEGGKG